MKLHSFFWTVLILFILTFLLAPSASAFAIAPGKTILEFTPNAVAQQEILLINTEQITKELRISTLFVNVMAFNKRQQALLMLKLS